MRTCCVRAAFSIEDMRPNGASHHAPHFPLSQPSPTTSGQLSLLISSLRYAGYSYDQRHGKQHRHVNARAFFGALAHPFRASQFPNITGVATQDSDNFDLYDYLGDSWGLIMLRPAD